jgi:hypothetical protein
VSLLAFDFVFLLFFYLGLNWEENVLLRDEDGLSTLGERVVAEPVSSAIVM